MSFIKTLTDWKKLLNKGVRYANSGSRPPLTYTEAKTLIRIARFCHAVNLNLRKELKRNTDIDDLDLITCKPIDYGKTAVSINKYLEVLFNEIDVRSVCHDHIELVRHISNMLTLGRAVTLTRIRHAFIKEILETLICDVEFDDKVLIKYHVFHDHTHLYTVDHRFIILLSMDAEEYTMSGHVDIAVIDTHGIVHSYHKRKNISTYGARFPHFLQLTTRANTRISGMSRITVEKPNFQPFPYAWCILRERNYRSDTSVAINAEMIPKDVVNQKDRVVTLTRWNALLKHFQITNKDFIHEDRYEPEPI